MIELNPRVDLYLADGCGRCVFYNTPRCKVNDWRDVLTALRAIIATTNVVEEIKWSIPTYTVNGGNVFMLTALRGYAAISFFKGVLLKDEQKLLQSPGENSQSDRYFKITSVEQANALAPMIVAYINEAIEIEKAGLKVQYIAKNPEYPEELVARFAEDPALKAAFEALTPGRQRGYLYFFTGAKQSATRASRIEKYASSIMSGKGIMDDKYKC